MAEGSSKLLYAIFWVIPRRLNFICRRFGKFFSIFIGENYTFCIIIFLRHISAVYSIIIMNSTKVHKAELCYTYCFSTATFVARTRLNVPVYVQCLSCYIVYLFMVTPRCPITAIIKRSHTGPVWMGECYKIHLKQNGGDDPQALWYKIQSLPRYDGKKSRSAFIIVEFCPVNRLNDWLTDWLTHRKNWETQIMQV
jgi:hypothetical protein